MSRQAYAQSALHPVLAHDGEKQVVLPASEAWPRLQSLHSHALLESSKGDLTVPSPKSAKSVYAHSLGSALGQFGTAHPALRDTMFHSLVDHVSSTGSMDGLESLYASGLNHTGVTGGPLHDRAMRTAKAVGFPKVSGGGLRPLVLTPKQSTADSPPNDLGKKLAYPYKYSQGPVAQAGDQLFNVGYAGFLAPAGGGLPGGGGGNPLLGTPSPGDNVFGGQTLGVPERPGVGSTQAPAGSPTSRNPGGSQYAVPLMGNPNKGLGDEFGVGANIGRAGGPLSENPGVGNYDFSELFQNSKDAAMQEVFNDVGALAAGRNDPKNTGSGLGPTGGDHVWTRPGGVGDPSSSDGFDLLGTASRWANEHPILAGGAMGAAVPLVMFGPGVVGGGAATAGGGIETAGDLALVVGALAIVGAVGGYLLTSTVNNVSGKPKPDDPNDTTIKPDPDAKPLPPPPKDPKSGGGFQGTDEGTGGGPLGPHSSGYLPSDQTGSPSNPHSMSYFPYDEAGPIGPRSFSSVPSDDTGSPIGPRSMRGTSLDVLPNPEGNSPGTPHSREL